jgi:ELWxxDGT repeat protein
MLQQSDDACEAAVMSQVLFSGSDANNNLNLWVTDGTSGGTKELTFVGSGGLDPGDITVLGSKALFIGAKLHLNLWVTDGTSAGTSELSVTGADSFGLHPEYITVLGSKALFRGQDAGGHENLWVTDGTATGTRELTVAGADSFGLLSEPFPDFTVFGSKVLFVGDDALGRSTLWVTDGTAGGTSELTGIVAGSPEIVQFASGFTAFGSKVLFEAKDLATGDMNLWVTDGSSAGTSELSVTGAWFGGLFGCYFVNGAVDPDFTVLSGRVLFSGKDTNGYNNLWITNGTSPGTHELSVSGGYSQGLFPDGDHSGNVYSGFSPEFTVLGSKVLFEGQDAGARFNLWVTDGTSAGTGELAVAGASSNGLFAPLSTPVSAQQFKVLGGQALFAGRDASGHNNLWVTDGTSAGTRELTVTGASPSGLNPYAFTVVGGQVLFGGVDVSGRVNVWTTDGTSSGTRELTVSGADPGGLLNLGFAPDFTVLSTSSPPPPPNPPPDAGTTADMILRHPSDGKYEIYDLGNNAVLAGYPLGQVGTDWQFGGLGDFSGGDTTDMILRYANTGAFEVYDTSYNNITGPPHWHRSA